MLNSFDEAAKTTFHTTKVKGYLELLNAPKQTIPPEQTEEQVQLSIPHAPLLLRPSLIINIILQLNLRSQRRSPLRQQLLQLPRHLTDRLVRLPLLPLLDRRIVFRFGTRVSHGASGVGPRARGSE